MAKKIREGGYVIGKEYRPARDKMTINGNEIPAAEEKYILTVVSGFLISKKDCFDSASIAYYTVDKEIFDKAEFLSPCDVICEITSTDNGMKTKGLSFSFASKGQLKVAVSE